MHFQTSITDLQDVLGNELADIYSSVEHLVSGDISSTPNALKGASKSISLVRDRMTDLQLSASMPSHLQPMLERLMNELTEAETHMQKVEGFVNKYHKGPKKTSLGTSTVESSTHNRILSNKEDSSTKYHFHSGVSKADHQMRVKSRHPGQGAGSIFGHHQQQGYHRARSSRNEGSMHRRLSGNNGDICIEPSSVDRKTEQCFRLADCAQYYGLYDMFVYSFGDDLDFDTGGLDDKLVVFDEGELQQKVSGEYTSECYVLGSRYSSSSFSIPITLIVDQGPDIKCRHP